MLIGNFAEVTQLDSSVPGEASGSHIQTQPCFPTLLVICKVTFIKDDKEVPHNFVSSKCCLLWQVLLSMVLFMNLKSVLTLHICPLEMSKVLV